MAAPRRRAATARRAGVSRHELLAAIERIAPPELAAEWDNTGLLVEARRQRDAVRRVLLCIDLTAAVVAEAQRLAAELVIAYHPPIFRGYKRLDAADPQQQAVLAALAAGLAVYSPHTALDAVPGGIADWLAEGLAGPAGPRDLRACGEGDFGRAFTLPRQSSVAALLPRIREHLGVAGLRLALPAAGRRHRVRTAAVAAGAGGAVLRGEVVDLWLTGELSHHDALSALAQGTAVVLAEHSNTERGYLARLQQRLRRALGAAVELRISRQDRDPYVYA